MLCQGCQPARDQTIVDQHAASESHVFAQSKQRLPSFLRFLPFEVGRGQLCSSGQCRAAMDMDPQASHISQVQDMMLLMGTFRVMSPHQEKHLYRNS